MSGSVLFKNVTKKYKMYKKTSEKLLDLALPNGYGKDFYALQNISFAAEKGDIIGIIGVNGAGKSTMSNLIAGVIPPSEGTIKIEGDAALISIGAGLNNQLTGRENIELKCLMLGFSKPEVQSLMPEIIEFADIGDFIDQPVKSYSSGMKSRLGFAISVNIDPDILVIDEALSVGDQTFTQKCLDKMNIFKEKGKTIFFISHSIAQVKEFCQKALWLEAGEIKEYGSIEEVIPKYEQFIKEFNKMSKAEKKRFNQQIVEKRSKKSDITENDITVPRKKIKKKKVKRKGFMLNSFIFLFILLTISIFLFVNRSSVLSYFNAENKVQSAKAKATESVNGHKVSRLVKEHKRPAQIVPKDIRYVQVPTGYVRDVPDISSSHKVSNLSFGDAIIVDKTQADPAEGNLTWLRFISSDGQEEWISKDLVTRFTALSNEKIFIEKASKIVMSNDLKKEIANLDKPAQDKGSSRKLNVDIKSQTGSQLIDLFGQPALLNGHNAYLYHARKNDYIFYSSDSVSFDKLTIKPAVE